ncbi:MAG: hypothetical protein JWP57_2344 [Spirosoma sp.]|nr:hypothetical protein [Spirosoma sp.]
MMILENTAPVITDYGAVESKWVHLLRVHVQEWKNHYNQVNQAIQELEDEHEQIRAQAGPLSALELQQLIASQDEQIDELINYYQSKRESIRLRQQQELEDL